MGEAWCSPQEGSCLTNKNISHGSTSQVTLYCNDKRRQLVAAASLIYICDHLPSCIFVIKFSQGETHFSEKKGPFVDQCCASHNIPWAEITELVWLCWWKVKHLWLEGGDTWAEVNWSGHSGRRQRALREAPGQTECGYSGRTAVRLLSPVTPRGNAKFKNVDICKDLWVMVWFKNIRLKRSCQKDIWAIPTFQQDHLSYLGLPYATILKVIMPHSSYPNLYSVVWVSRGTIIQLTLRLPYHWHIKPV